MKHKIKTLAMSAFLACSSVSAGPQLAGGDVLGEIMSKSTSAGTAMENRLFVDAYTKTDNFTADFHSFGYVDNLNSNTLFEDNRFDVGSASIPVKAMLEIKSLRRSSDAQYGFRMDHGLPGSDYGYSEIAVGTKGAYGRVLTGKHVGSFTGELTFIETLPAHGKNTLFTELQIMYGRRKNQPFVMLDMTDMKRKSGVVYFGSRYTF